MITTTAAILLAATPAPVDLQSIPPPTSFETAVEAPAQPVPAEQKAEILLPAQAPDASVEKPVDQPDVSADQEFPADQTDGNATINDGASEIVVTARAKSAGDPIEAINAKSYEATAAIDGAVVEPVVMAYQKAIPSPVRSGLRNFFGNLHEPVVFVNFLLQHKIGKAAETVGRFAVNSTVGLAGLVDVAKSKPINLPRRPNGFADTMGFYGVKPGAYLYLPLIGPTTVRDLAGKFADRMLVPMAVGGALSTPGYALPINAARELDRRSENDEQMRKLRADTNDPYVASREFYLNRRQREIDNLRGKPLDPPITDPSHETAAAKVQEVR